jgi:porin
MPVDMNALFPVPKQDKATLSELYYLQFLTPWLGVMAGKMSPRDANVFAHDETEQFMNIAFNINPVIGTTLPILCTLAAGGILRPRDWFMLTTLALDSEGGCDKSGFDTVLKRGTSVIQTAEFTIKPFGLPGHQRVGWTWTDRSQIQFSQSPIDIIEAIITGSTAGLKREKKDWSVIYDFDQYLYLQPGSTDRGLGLFGRVGVGNKIVNPIQGFYSIGLSGKGLVPGREKDSFGIGYYYIHLSEELPRFIKKRGRDEQGGELYYNVAVTPWLHLTPDLQIIHPAAKKVNTTVVGGLRFKADF